MQEEKQVITREKSAAELSAAGFESTTDWYQPDVDRLAAFINAEVPETSSIPVVFITGLPGSGKTSFAYAVAKHTRAVFFLSEPKTTEPEESSLEHAVQHLTQRLKSQKASNREVHAVVVETAPFTSVAEVAQLYTIARDHRLPMFITGSWSDSEVRQFARGCRCTTLQIRMAGRFRVQRPFRVISRYSDLEQQVAERPTLIPRLLSTSHWLGTIAGIGFGGLVFGQQQSLARTMTDAGYVIVAIVVLQFFLFQRDRRRTQHECSKILNAEPETFS